MGTPAFAALCLDRLLAGRHSVIAVVSRPDRRSGRGQQLRASEVKRLAERCGIEVMAPSTPSEQAFRDHLRELAPHLVVVVAYGRILPREVLDIPTHGCINAHASLLPRLRGAAPIERAILEGHDKTGVSIIRMNERMDEGDIILSAAVDLHSGVDGGTLRATLAELSAELLDEAIERIADGTAVYTPQDSSLATFAPPIKREEMRIDWSEDAAAVLRRVMAFRPRPGAFAYACGKRLKILSAELADSAPSTAEAGVILEASAKGLLVACGEGTVLVTSVQPEGRREMSVGDFLRGFPSTAPLLSFDVET